VDLNKLSNEVQEAVREDPSITPVVLHALGMSLWTALTNEITARWVAETTLAKAWEQAYEHFGDRVWEIRDILLNSKHLQDTELIQNLRKQEVTVVVSQEDDIDDLSYLGTFSDDWHRFAFDTEFEGFEDELNFFSPRTQHLCFPARYFIPTNCGKPSSEEYRKAGRAAYKRALGYYEGEWHFIVLIVKVYLGGRVVMEDSVSGIESDNETITDIAREIIEDMGVPKPYIIMWEIDQ
jgi:hypothetical protein